MLLRPPPAGVAPTLRAPLVRRLAPWAFAPAVALAAWCALRGLKHWLNLPDTSSPNYFAELAWSFRRGRVDLMFSPPYGHDLSPFQGKVYAYWPPLPAALMAIFLPAQGPGAFPQRLFVMAFAATNAALAYLIARRLLRGLGWVGQEGWAVGAGLTFALGTSNVVLAVHASHWFVGQVITSTFVLFSLWFAVERHPARRRLSLFVAACLMAAATLGRQHTVFGAVTLAYLALSDERYGLKTDPRRPLASVAQLAWARPARASLAALALPFAAAGAVALAYNRARFGSWFENGITYHNMNAAFRGDYAMYGAFSPVYMPRNVYFTLLRPPFFEAFDAQDRDMGFSLFAQSPILLLAFGRRPPDSLRPFVVALWVTVALVVAPIMLLMGTGWRQFGARYLYDVAPFLGVLALVNRRHWGRHWPLVLAACSIVMNVGGSMAVVTWF